MRRILVTGSRGQIGSELLPALRNTYGREAVVASDIAAVEESDELYERVDVTDRGQIERVVETYDVEAVFHLAAILSATGEQHPQRAFRVNVEGLYNVLEVARQHGLDKVVVPSSIAVFGAETPEPAREISVLRPTTMYGITKVVTELLAQYYAGTYGLDVRGIRFPGILSHKTEPGGGTTDYAVQALRKAVSERSYTYFVRPETTLPFVYMPDAIDALVQLFEANESDLRYRCEYNVSAMSFSARELTAEIKKHRPEFKAAYEPDDRQSIVDSWPANLDDTAARTDWNWSPRYGLAATVEDMLANLGSG